MLLADLQICFKHTMAFRTLICLFSVFTIFTNQFMQSSICIISQMKPAREEDKREYKVEFLQKVALKLRYIGKIVVYGANKCRLQFMES